MVLMNADKTINQFTIKTQDIIIFNFLVVIFNSEYKLSLTRKLLSIPWYRFLLVFIIH